MLDIFLKKEIYGSIIVVVCAIIIYQFVRLTFKLSYINIKKNKRYLTIIKLVQNFIKVLLIIICGLLILQLFGFDVSTLLAGLGIAGLVVGLGLQDTIKDVLAGLSIIFEDYYSLGDWITYNDFKGEVIGFSIRATKIKNSNGDVMTFANRMVSDIVNYTKAASILFIDIPTSAEEECEKVEKALSKVIKEILRLENVIEKNTKYLGIGELLNKETIYRIQINCLPGEQFNIKREALKIIKKTLRSEKIKNS